MKRILLFTTILILCLCSPAWAAVITCSAMVADNSTDNTAALNACMTAAQSEVEKTVNIPSSANIYYFASYITVPADISIVGVGTVRVRGTFRLSDGSKLINLDFEDASRAVIMGEIGYSPDEYIDGAEVRDCSFKSSEWCSVLGYRVNDCIINNNTFTNNGTGSNIQILGGKRNVITNNYIRGGKTSIIFKYSLVSNGGGLESLLTDNIIMGNDYGGFNEEGISFDIVGNASNQVACLEYDTISSVSGTDVVLSHANWAPTGNTSYVGYDMIFLSGSIAGEHRRITAQSDDTFTLDTAPTGAAAIDEIVIGATFKNNIIAYNLTTSGNSAILIFGMGFDNRIHNNNVGTGWIKVLSLDNTEKATGSVTGTWGRGPSGYNLLKDNIAARTTFHYHVFSEINGHANTYSPYYSYENASIDNTLSDRVWANYQHLYTSGNTGTTEFYDVTPLGSTALDLTEPTCANVGLTCATSCISGGISNLNSTCPTDQICCVEVNVEGNTAPNGIITTPSGGGTTIDIDSTQTLAGSGSDAEGDTLTYTWVIPTNTFKVWDGATTYALNDLVEDDGVAGAYYKSIQASNTNHNPPDATWWVDAEAVQNPGTGTCDTAGVYNIGLTVNDGTVDDPTPASTTITVNAAGGTSPTTEIWSRNTTGSYAGDYAEGDATFVWAGHPVTNYGDNNVLWIQHQAVETHDYLLRIMLSFDLSHVNISGETVTGATLGLYLDLNPGNLTTNIEVWSCSDAFVEGEATWNIYSTGNNWTGIHGKDTFLAETEFTTSSSEDTFYTFSSAALTSYLNTVASTGATAYLVLVGDVAAAGNIEFNSDDEADGTRPYLEITYGASSASVPEIISITTSTSDGSYKDGDSIGPFHVTFNESVKVTGTPHLTLELGANDVDCNYSSGTGTATLTFAAFTVASASSHISADLDGIELDRNSGTILSTDDDTSVAVTGEILDSMITGSTTVGSLAYNKDIVIDTTAPTIVSVNNTDTHCTGDSTITGIGTLVKFAIVSDTTGLYITYSPAYYQIEMEVNLAETVYAEFQGFGDTTDTLIMGFYTTAGMRSADLNFSGNLILGAGGGIADPAGNDLNLNMGALSLAGVAAIVLEVPYPSTSPKEFTTTNTLAAAISAGWYSVPDDYIQWTEDATDAFDASASDGTSGHEINYNGQGFTITGNQTFGDYSIISRFIHGSTVILGLGDTHKYSLIPVGDILQVPEGATGCTIHDDSIRGTLDLDETVTVKNTWVTTVDLAGIGATETATFNNCAFVQSEAVIDATLGVDGSTSYDAECQFSITTADCFKDYAGADYHLTGGSPLKDAGEDTGNDIDLDGRPTPMGSAHDIGAYELSRSGGSMGMGMGLSSFCPHRRDD